ncbi:MAG TPA: formate dehydrogenase subunit beta [Kofleriaceae bacterium]|nr:formate dehydrogenase subunit beta [Kofleriaceae bacterium]
MSNSPQLEIRRSSASLRGQGTGIRELPVVSKYIDTTTCIGCKACEVACQEWNDLENVHTQQVGTYQTLPSLDANLWNLIKFREEEHAGGFAWLMRKDQCMHCADPGCLAACPAPGAIVQYENGIVDVNPDACIGCGLCATGCPFDVPRFHPKTGKMAKCTLCVDRVAVGIEPACIKACPTGCLQFGNKDDMVALGHERVAQLKANGFPAATLYDPEGVSGTGVVTVLGHGDHPEWYSLPADPQIPVSVFVTKSVLKPVGMVAMLGAVGAAFAHYLRFGPKDGAATNGLATNGLVGANGVGVARVSGVAGATGAVEVEEIPPPNSETRVEDAVIGNYIVRHRLSSRVIHWSVALFFFGALFSGLPIWTPIFGWMANLFGGLEVCRWLHAWLGIAFSAAALVMVIHWARDMRMERGDWAWLGPKMIRYFRRNGDDPDTGRYNGGQKIFFFLVALLALCLLGSGLVLWFPMSLGRPLAEISWILHDAAFILFAASIVVHIYLGTAALPGTFRSMTRGVVSKRYARLHHPRWYREVTGDDWNEVSPGRSSAPEDDHR